MTAPTQSREPTAEQVEEWFKQAAAGTDIGYIDRLATLAYQAGQAAEREKLRAGGVELPTIVYGRTVDGVPCVTLAEYEHHLKDYGDRRAAAATLTADVEGDDPRGEPAVSYEQAARWVRCHAPHCVAEALAKGLNKDLPCYIPDGWALVLKEPTPNMYATAGAKLTARIKQIQATGRQIWSSDEALARLVYETMLAAAPTPPKP